MSKFGIGEEWALRAYALLIALLLAGIWISLDRIAGRLDPNPGHVLDEVLENRKQILERMRRLPK